MNNNKNKKKYPKDIEKDWRVTPVMLAETYDERLGEEKKETLAATILAETFPDLLDYEDLGERQKQYGQNEEKQI